VERSAVVAMIRAHYAAAGVDERRVAADYADDAILDFPQGGERIRGAANIFAFRSAYPAQVRLSLRRVTGAADTWIIESTISYDGEPQYAVAIWELMDRRIAHETVHVADGWAPPEWRARWVEPLPSSDESLEASS
jgi:hypothetical protein